MDNETELDDPLELSLQERMNLSIKQSDNALIWIGIVTIITIILSISGLVIYEANLSDFIEPEEGFHNMIISSFGIIILTSVIAFVWLLKIGRKAHKENQSIIREYTQQAYLIALSISDRLHSDDDIPLDFYDIARDIFPELKKLDIESVKKTGEVKAVEEKIVDINDVIGRKKDDYTFDVVTNTENGMFIIKYFKKNASYDDLKQCLEIIGSTKMNNIAVLRVVCISEGFDSDILKKYEELEKIKSYTPIDLILVNEKGFSALKISDET